MPKNHPPLTAERLRELLSYDPETGIFLWRVSLSRRVALGMTAGTLCGGYTLIRICEKAYRAHRLAWLYVHGRWPIDQLDHINGIRDDNRIANLREANNVEQQQNRAMQRNNTSGHHGVGWCKRDAKWHARIMFKGVRKSLGFFDSLEEASAAYLRAKAELHQFQPVPRSSTERETP